MTVYLVGAGPGDPELITVRGARLLGRADVVVQDRLADDRLLALARPDAERIDVGKRAGHATMTQDEINRLLVEKGRAGLEVVRLKGGDPFVFGRGGEEVAALDAAGVAYEVVPGVTSAIAAPAAAGIPVTMRDQARSFTVVTGHDDAGRGDVDWEALARTGGTLVILMGAAGMAGISRRLRAAGLDGATPVTAVRWATTERQEVLRSDLAGAEHLRLQAPCTVVVGPVAAHHWVWPAS